MSAAGKMSLLPVERWVLAIEAKNDALNSTPLFSEAVAAVLEDCIDQLAVLGAIVPSGSLAAASNVRSYNYIHK